MEAIVKGFTQVVAYTEMAASTGSMSPYDDILVKKPAPFQTVPAVPLRAKPEF